MQGYYLLKIGRASDEAATCRKRTKSSIEIFFSGQRYFLSTSVIIEAVTLLKSIKKRGQAKFTILNKQLLQHQMDARDGSDVKKMCH